MNRRIPLLAAVLAAVLAAACSTAGTQSAADDDDKVYVTGSRIPRNDRTAAGMTTIQDPNAIKSMVRPGGTAGSSAN